VADQDATHGALQAGPVRAPRFGTHGKMNVYIENYERIV